MYSSSLSWKSNIFRSISVLAFEFNWKIILPSLIAQLKEAKINGSKDIIKVGVECMFFVKTFV
jgi:hypothetical protein